MVQNPGCGFGLWGRLEPGIVPGNINNLSEVMKQVKAESESRTLYRAVVSLDEATVLRKGLGGRDAWQKLVSSHMETISKENSIELKDLRWCAAYHHEKGHPHAHIVFWDGSGEIRAEGMSHDRFEIAAEKIRASFNKDIFREELRQLRGEQDAARKELRAMSRNHVEGFESLDFFERDTAEANAVVQFYPKTLGQRDAALLSGHLENLLYVLPDTGQLKYQYLSPEAKGAVDIVSRLVLEVTTLQKPYAEYMKSVEEISRTYGNSDESILRQKDRAEGQILKDVGNDVLATIKELGWLELRQAGRRGELQNAAHRRMLEAADTALSENLVNPDFREKLSSIAAMLPPVYTPRQEVLKDPALNSSLRALTLKCVNDKGARSAAQVSQAFSGQGKTSPEPGQTAQEEPKARQEFKVIYNHVHRRLFQVAAEERGWTPQQQRANVTGFLLAFCRTVSPNNRLLGNSSRYLMKRELSKQAKSERAIQQSNTSGMWEAQTWY